MLFVDIREAYSNEVGDEVERLLQHFRTTLTSVGRGRNREAFVTKSGDYVVKVPVSLQGFDDNIFEAREYRKEVERCRKGGEGTLARARILHVLPVGVPLLVMEKLDTNIDFAEMPPWAASVDLQQVGFDRHGNVKAYDYGVY